MHSNGLWSFIIPELSQRLLTVSSEEIQPPLNAERTESILPPSALTDRLVFYTLSELITWSRASLST